MHTYLSTYFFLPSTTFSYAKIVTSPLTLPLILTIITTILRQPYAQQQPGGMQGGAGTYGGYPGGMGGPGPSSSMGTSMSVQPTPQQQQPQQPQQKPVAIQPVAVAPVVPSGPPPECVQQLGQYIDHLTSICSPPEKRQMQVFIAVAVAYHTPFSIGESHTHCLFVTTPTRHLLFINHSLPFLTSA